MLSVHDEAGDNLLFPRVFCFPYQMPYGCPRLCALNIKGSRALNKEILFVRLAVGAPESADKHRFAGSHRGYMQGAPVIAGIPSQGGS
ncbi:hypothetical protein PTE_01276 [Photorhabdus khanii NC19]|uniref:Uncharacterized protein n=1 Tax=Photorhabdus khanii NC19 TaxID=1004151 RepID=W3VA15_9GAMM|nr:hypothetical protein PTE_01276 [Photorhabdus khanii NC19]